MSIHLNKDLVLGADIGGSHVAAAIVNINTGEILPDSFHKGSVNAGGKSEDVLQQWVKVFKSALSSVEFDNVKGIGIAMPGPFDYDNGISFIKGVNKYESLYGLNVKGLLKKHLNIGNDELTIFFENDASCFGLGENFYGKAIDCRRVLAVTLGTGLGATFLLDNHVQRSGVGVPPEGFLYHTPFKDGIAEDYISSRWLIRNYNRLNENLVQEVKEIFQRACSGDDKAFELFVEYGKNLADCLLPWIKSFKADCLVIGGSISKAASIFLPLVQEVFNSNGIDIPIKISDETEISSITGAASLFRKEQDTTDRTIQKATPWRKTNQPLMPICHAGLETSPGEYNIYPSTSLENGKIFYGFETLAQWITEQKTVLIDGCAGVDWEVIRQQLDEVFKKEDLKACWHEMTRFQKEEDVIEDMVKPYLGEENSVWGKRAKLQLGDFFEINELHQLRPDESFDLRIIFGVGAGLSNWDAPLVYVDLPKNEFQFRMRAKTAGNLGSSDYKAPAVMYKRSYFVDWVLLREHQQKILDRIAIIADGQWKDKITWIKNEDLKKGLQQIAHNSIRVRPWFEPGAWGGQWMKENFQQLSKDEVNYAWSFELIVPENGLVFESDRWQLEVAFDWLMFHFSPAVLGKDEPRFGKEFPIRFDFLDTMDGGNLSVQCHPRLSYIQEQFGETITQDETYYILECKEDAKVYLGFQENIDATAFRRELERSNDENLPVQIEKFVQWHPSKKHDLFLIPNGTVHSSGTNNLVLEISATPYIFTFKMYDWLRLDLNGEPRPINIDHAFHNLDFERKGKKVQEELISRPYVLEKGKEWQIVHLPTHKDHFYDIHRLEFSKDIMVQTNHQCHILMLVEGTSIQLETERGFMQRYNYAETFIVPAAAGSYTLINEGAGTAKVIKAFIK